MRALACLIFGHLLPVRHPLAGDICPRCFEPAHGYVDPDRMRFVRERYLPLKSKGEA